MEAREPAHRDEPPAGLAAGGVLRDRNLHLVFAVTLMAVLGVSSIAPALPKVGRVLDLTPQETGWLVTIFTLPGVALTPVAGVLADRFGRRRILVPALWVFALAGAACALAGSVRMLLILRLIQGMGAASLGSLNVTVLGDLYQGRRRAAAMGYNAAVLSVGTAAYPALGGLLAQLHWRLPFALPLLAIPVALAVQRLLRNPEPDGGGSLREYFGAVGRGLRHRAILGIFTVSVVTFVLLYSAMIIYLPQLLDRRYHLAPAIIGIFLTGSSAVTGLVSWHLGKLSRRHGEGRLIRLGFLLFALALVLVPVLPGPWALALPAALFGAGMGLTMPSLMTMLASLAPQAHRGAFMSLNGMVLRLGQTLGPLVGGLAYGLGGLDAPFLAGAVLAVITFLLILATLPRRAAADGPAQESA
ncbi:MAG: MFS transporter [Candidatus Krumholzibacteriia bacterium]